MLDYLQKNKITVGLLTVFTLLFVATFFFKLEKPNINILVKTLMATPLLTQLFIMWSAWYFD